MRSLKKVCAAGVATFMLTFGVAGVTANAEASSPCPHLWTAEEFAETVLVDTLKHTHNNGKECIIYYMRDYYNVRCRVCGEIVGSVPGDTKAVHTGL